MAPRAAAPGMVALSGQLLAQVEQRFVELQAGAQVLVGVDLWEQAQADQASTRDRFAKWLDGQP